MSTGKITSKRLALVGGVVALVLTTAACGGSASENKTDSGGDTSGKHYKYFVLPKFIGIPVFEQTNIGSKEAANELGDTVTFNGPTTPSAQEQVTFINNAAQQGVNAIITSANDPNALAPSLKQASSQGIMSVTFDSDVAKDARSVFISGPKPDVIAKAMLESVGSQIDFKGDIAFMSTTPDATNQNSWIGATKTLLKDPKYSGMKLVATVYGKEDDAVATTVTRGLLQSNPNLRGLLAYTGGGAAAARVLQSEKKCGDVALYALTLPSVMEPVMKTGCVKESAIWSFKDLGYLGVYASRALLDKKISGKVGESFDAGKLGKQTIEENNTVYLSKLQIINKANAGSLGF